MIPPVALGLLVALMTELLVDADAHTVDERDRATRGTDVTLRQTARVHEGPGGVPVLVLVAG